jgi:hypothetical protein
VKNRGIDGGTEPAKLTSDVFIHSSLYGKKISISRRFRQKQPFDPTPRQEAAVCWHMLGISLYDQLHIDIDTAKFYR